MTFSSAWCVPSTIVLGTTIKAPVRSASLDSRTWEGVTSVNAGTCSDSLRSLLLQAMFPSDRYLANNEALLLCIMDALNMFRALWCFSMLSCAWVGIKLLLLPLPLPLLLQFLLGLELQEVLSDLRLSPQVAAPILEWQVSLCLFEHVEDMAWLL